MPGVSVKIVGYARSLFDSDSYTFDVRPGMTIRDILTMLSVHAGADFSKAVYDVKADKMNEYIAVFVNSKEARAMEGLDTRLKDGDVVTVLPPMAGG